MKAQKKISYSEDVDILMIQLSDKKIDDSYETNFGVVEVAEDGEPVILEIFQASKFLKELGKAVPKTVQKEVWSGVKSSVSVPHRVK